MEKRIAVCVLKALFAAYLVTGLSLLIFAFVLYKFGVSENALELGVLFIYILSSAIGGFFIGKCMEVKRLLWGLFVGFLYACILVAISFIVRGNLHGVLHAGITKILLCIGAGALGAFLS